MIFLSVQPDDFYFMWQLELQIYNFNKLGIDSQQIHILIGYDSRIGLRPFFSEMMERNKEKASFYPYPDTRLCKSYQPSIRPHIVKKHLLAYPSLEEATIFYHDSDIIFRILPDFEQLQSDEYWYVADTRAYLDSIYIRKVADDALFNEMCSIVNISPQQVIENDINCGGAQYLLTNTTVAYWEKVEKDSEELFNLLTDFNVRQENEQLRLGIKRPEKNGIQAWCAEMWSTLWNAIYFEKKIAITPEFDFCWADSNISRWNSTNILHYTGHINKDDKEFFAKGNYKNYEPYYDIDLKKINPESSSFPLVQLMADFTNQQKKIDLTDVSFVIPVRIDSISRFQNLLAQVKYLDKYFNTRILIYESDRESKINQELLPNTCTLLFQQCSDQVVHPAQLNTIMINQVVTPVMALVEQDFIVSIDQTLQAVQLIRDKQAHFVSPFDGNYIKVDTLFKAMFEKILDPLLLTYNKSKFKLFSETSWNGWLFISKEAFHLMPADFERIERIKNLGYKIQRINGPIFHLPHDEQENANYEFTKCDI